MSEGRKSALQRASDAVKKAKAEADGPQKDLGKVSGAKAMVEHAKGKWIGGTEKGIAAAQAALTKAKTDAEREAAKKDLAKWQANKDAGVKELKVRQAAYVAANPADRGLVGEWEKHSQLRTQARQPRSIDQGVYAHRSEVTGEEILLKRTAESLQFRVSPCEWSWSGVGHRVMTPRQ